MVVEAITALRKNTSWKQGLLANLSKLEINIISRPAKMQVYKTLIRLVATYGAETWTLTVVEESAMRISERKIIRRIYGPVMENNIWSIGYSCNEEMMNY
jgi:hypothetical protein